MKVEEFFVKLSENELSNINIGTSGLGVVEDNNLNHLMSPLNDILTRLHTTYTLKIKTHTLETIPNVFEYNLAISNLVKVLKVFNLDRNQYVPINNLNSKCGVLISGNRNIQVAEIATYLLTYQANHPLINKNNLGSELDVPDNLIEPISNYIAGKVYNKINTLESIKTGSEYLRKYEEGMALINNADGLTDSKIEVNDKFEINGWI